MARLRQDVVGLRLGIPDRSRCITCAPNFCACDAPATPTMAIAKATAAIEWITEALLDPGTETVH
jgi:hypothetical protein